MKQFQQRTLRSASTLVMIALMAATLPMGAMALNAGQTAGKVASGSGLQPIASSQPTPVIKVGGGYTLSNDGSVRYGERVIGSYNRQSRELKVFSRTDQNRTTQIKALLDNATSKQAVAPAKAAPLTPIRSTQGQAATGRVISQRPRVNEPGVLEDETNLGNAGMVATGSTMPTVSGGGNSGNRLPAPTASNMPARLTADGETVRSGGMMNKAVNATVNAAQQGNAARHSALPAEPVDMQVDSVRSDANDDSDREVAIGHSPKEALNKAKPKLENARTIAKIDREHQASEGRIKSIGDPVDDGIKREGRTKPVGVLPPELSGKEAHRPHEGISVKDGTITNHKSGISLDAEGIVRNAKGVEIAKYDGDVNKFIPEKGTVLSEAQKREIKQLLSAGTVNSKGLILKIPPHGEVNELAGGLKIDGKGIIRNASGAFIVRVQENGSFIDAQDQPVATAKATKMLKEAAKAQKKEMITKAQSETKLARAEAYEREKKALNNTAKEVNDARATFKSFKTGQNIPTATRALIMFFGDDYHRKTARALGGDTSKTWNEQINQWENQYDALNKNDVFKVEEWREGIEMVLAGKKPSEFSQGGSKSFSRNPAPTQWIAELSDGKLYGAKSKENSLVDAQRKKLAELPPEVAEGLKPALEMNHQDFPLTEVEDAKGEEKQAGITETPSVTPPSVSNDIGTPIMEQPIERVDGLVTGPGQRESLPGIIDDEYGNEMGSNRGFRDSDHVINRR